MATRQTPESGSEGGSSVRKHSTWATWRFARLSSLGLALVLLVGTSGAVAAQESPPSANTGWAFEPATRIWSQNKA